MIEPIPAPGFTMISGTRKPPASWGEKLWCQLRNGWVDRFAPWPVATTVWIHQGTAGDVVAVKREHELPKEQPVRPANGSYE